MPAERLVYLVDKPRSGGQARDRCGDARRRSPRRSRRFAAQAGPDDLVFITLIGHGTFNGGKARFNLTGPDMGPADFDALLKKLPAKQIVFVNTASASGPFVEELSAQGAHDRHGHAQRRRSTSRRCSAATSSTR